MTFLELVRAKSTAAINSTFLEHLRSPFGGTSSGSVGGCLSLELQQEITMTAEGSETLELEIDLDSSIGLELTIETTQTLSIEL